MRKGQNGNRGAEGVLPPGDKPTGFPDAGAFVGERNCHVTRGPRSRPNSKDPFDAFMSLAGRGGRGGGDSVSASNNIDCTVELILRIRVVWTL